MVPAFSASVSGLQHRLKRPLLMLSTVVGTGRGKKKNLMSYYGGISSNRSQGGGHKQHVLVGGKVLVVGSRFS
jgi:hypothetical protein